MTIESVKSVFTSHAQISASCRTLTEARFSACARLPFSSVFICSGLLTMSGDLHLADSGKEVPAKPAAWQPRWKTDSSIQPSSYNAPDAPSHTGRFASSPRHDHGHSESRRSVDCAAVEHFLQADASVRAGRTTALQTLSTT